MFTFLPFTNFIKDIPWLFNIIFLHDTLHTLSNVDSIKIHRFDKGNDIQIFNSTDYVNKLDKLILDKRVFCELSVHEYKVYIYRSSCVKRSNDSIKVRLWSRCNTFHRLIDCRNVVNKSANSMFVLVHGASSAGMELVFGRHAGQSHGDWWFPITPPSRCAVLGMVESQLVGLLGKA